MTADATLHLKSPEVWQNSKLERKRAAGKLTYEGSMVNVFPSSKVTVLPPL